MKYLVLDSQTEINEIPAYEVERLYENGSIDELDISDGLITGYRLIPKEKAQ